MCNPDSAAVYLFALLQLSSGEKEEIQGQKTGDDESPEFDFADMKGKINIIHAQRWVYIHTNVYIYVA